MKYKIHKKTILHQGFFRLEVFDVEHERFDGGALRIQRELLERGDAVAILLYDKKADKVLLIEQEGQRGQVLQSYIYSLSCLHSP